MLNMRGQQTKINHAISYLEFYAYHFLNVMFMFFKKAQNFDQISLLI